MFYNFEAEERIFQREEISRMAAIMDRRQQMAKAKRNMRSERINKNRRIERQFKSKNGY